MKLGLGLGFTKNQGFSLPSFVDGAKVAIVGDSITQQNHRADNAKVASRNDGIYYWATRDIPSLSNGIWYDATATGGATPPLFRGFNFGLSGDALSDIDARTDPIINYNPDLIIFQAGTNTGTNNSSYAQKVASLDSILNKFLANTTAHIILGTVLPRQVSLTPTGSEISTAERDVLLQFNDYIRSKAGARITIWDGVPDTIDTQYSEGDDLYFSPRAGFTDDNVHPIVQGCYWAGISLRALLSQMVTGDFWLKDETNLISNPSYTGTGGFDQQGITGDVPNNWIARNVLPSGQNVTGTASVSSGVLTLVLTSDGLGGGSAPNTEAIEVLPFPLTSETLTNGTWYRTAIDVSVTGNTDQIIGGIELEFRNQTTGVYGIGLETISTDRATDPFPTGDLSFTIYTESIQYNTSDTLSTRLLIEIIENISGTVTFALSNPRLIAVPDPETEFPYTP